MLILSEKMSISCWTGRSYRAWAKLLITASRIASTGISGISFRWIPSPPHLNQTASILDYIHCGHINQWQRPVKWPIIIPASCRNEVHAVKMRYQKAANSQCIYKASQAFAPILSAVTNRKEPCIRQRDLLLMQGSAFRCLRDGAFYLFQANEAGPKIAFPYSYSTVAGGFGV